MRQRAAGDSQREAQRVSKPVAAAITGDNRSLPHCTRPRGKKPHRTRVQVSLSGLEPETYGLKVRCSTD